MQKELLIQYWRENYNFKEKEIEAFRIVKRENFVLKELEQDGIIHQFEQLTETSHKPVSQAEHTILIGKDKIEVTTI